MVEGAILMPHNFDGKMFIFKIILKSCSCLTCIFNIKWPNSKDKLAFGVDSFLVAALLPPPYFKILPTTLVVRRGMKYSSKWHTGELPGGNISVGCIAGRYPRCSHLSSSFYRRDFEIARKSRPLRN